MLTTLVRIAAAAALALAILPSTAHAGAGALRWPGAVYTDVTFSSFFGSPNTIMARFMPQYVRGYRGPIFGALPPRCVGCSPGPSFEVGLAQYGEGSLSGTGLVLEVGGVKRLYATSALEARTWHHIAVRFSTGWLGSAFRLYLDGQHLCALGDSCDLVVSGAAVPAGTLILGRSYNSTTSNELTGTHQFYGFIDDVGIFDAALSDSLIAAHAAPTNAISGVEQDLYAGWNFEAGSQPAVLSRPLIYGSSAFWNPFVGGSTHYKNGYDANEYDAPMLPYAADPYAIKLPFTPGEEWKVTQGYAGSASHYGVSAFALDMVRQDGSTLGADVYLPANGGYVVQADESCDDAQGQCSSNLIRIQLSPGVVISFMHLEQGSISEAFGGQLPAPGTWVAPNQKVAEVGNHPNGAHLHFGLRNTEADTGVTVPAVFKAYEVKSYGIWEPRNYGVLNQGDIVRRP